MKHLITKADMVKLEDLAIGNSKNKLRQMIKKAGTGSAEIIQEQFPPNRFKNVLVVAGGGNNGAAGLSTAHNLYGHGYKIEIFMVTNKLSDLVQSFLQKLNSLKIKKADYFDPTDNRYELLLDAMIGYGIEGNLRSPLVEYVASINEAEMPVVSLDTPTGLSIDTGRPSDQAIKSDLTIMFVAEKQGLYTKSASEHINNLKLIDIGIPKKAYAELGIRYPF